MEPTLELKIKKTAKKYYLLFLWPIIGLVFIFLVYALVDYLTFRLYGEIQAETFRNILRTTMAFFGLICVITVPVFVILGLIFASNFKKRIKELLQNPQYQNLLPEQIIYLAQGSLTGFFGYPVFALGNRLYLWGIISVLGIAISYLYLLFQGLVLQALNILAGIAVFIIAITLGIKGRQLAWEKSKWSSFDEFAKRQKLINWLTILFLIIHLSLSISIIFYTTMRQITPTLFKPPWQRDLSVLNQEEREKDLSQIKKYVYKNEKCGYQVEEYAFSPQEVYPFDSCYDWGSEFNIKAILFHPFNSLEEFKTFLGPELPIKNVKNNQILEDFKNKKIYLMNKNEPILFSLECNLDDCSGEVSKILETFEVFRPTLTNFGGDFKEYYLSNLGIKIAYPQEWGPLDIVDKEEFDGFALQESSSIVFMAPAAIKKFKSWYEMAGEGTPRYIMKPLNFDAPVAEITSTLKESELDPYFVEKRNINGLKAIRFFETRGYGGAELALSYIIQLPDKKDYFFVTLGNIPWCDDGDILLEKQSFFLYAIEKIKNGSANSYTLSKIDNFEKIISSIAPLK